MPAQDRGAPQTEIAAEYWASHRVDIDRRVAANAETADRELEAWVQRRALLGA